MFQVGVARNDITPPNCLGVGMLGWGNDQQRVRGVTLPIHARAVALRDEVSGRQLIFVSTEVCFMTEALRAAVMTLLHEKHSDLAIGDEELMLTATHSHCSPGGHSKYLLYNLTIPGFQPHVLAAYCEGIVKAIVSACRGRVAAHVRLSTGVFPKDSKVAFNRSLAAWNRNPEARDSEALDREMVLLRFDGVDGKRLGSVNWFAVHPTSMHSDYHFIHSDNKGVAANTLEAEARSSGHDDFVAVFAQGAAGDVSPNFMRHPGLKDVRGLYPDDEKSCAFNAGLQTDLARKIYEDAAASSPLTGGLASFIERHDFSKIEVDPKFTNGQTGIRTVPGVIGCNFMRGTAEGKGAPVMLIVLGVVLSRIMTYLRYFGIRLRGKKVRPPWQPDRFHGTKISFMDSGRGRIFGFSLRGTFLLPSFLHPTVANLKMIARDPKERRGPFTPQILPLQIARIGSLAFVAVPAEFTTVSGRRLRATVAAGLGELGIDRVILSGYANAYAGYVTTCEEYEQQAYEGASTHFGMWTLAGYQTVFSQMCQRIKSSLS